MQRQVTAAGDRWRAMVEAEHQQAVRVRDPGWQPPIDPFRSRVARFRADPDRREDPVLAALRDLVRPDDRVVDVGAGAGRYALALARHTREVVAIKPSPSMGAALLADAEQAGIRAIRLLATTWEEAPDVRGDVAFAAHVGHTTRRIEELLHLLDHSAQRWAALVLFADPPQHRLFPFWPPVHGEERRPLPHLPQLVAVLESLGRSPEVSIVPDAAWPLGPWERARDRLRGRLFLTPGSDADHRLEAAMAALLEDWGRGALGPRDRRPLPIALVRWRPGADSEPPRATALTGATTPPVAYLYYSCS